MAKFMLTYVGGNPPKSPEEGQQHMQAYQKWLADLGTAVVSPANPLKATHVVNSDGSIEKTSITGMSGYTVLEAQDIEQALEMAKSCPFLSIGGQLEVSEMVVMQM
ncbi:hypothetical protein [Vibrio sp. SCSIO 43136]|uniref:YciI family protein n=1 Tax=Vibrio sp. SCSIO 43136 TaxID=2819101 RepID=UPI0020752CB6|nr:hypothetical protein [Vibrio sp. SCSIO 43136]USD64024.1 hypothetical protein J4N39_07760 [Vibrio sp. SCSIO 43136]